MALRGLRGIRLRPANHTGPGQAPNIVVVAFARRVALIAAGRCPPILHVGALEQWRDFRDVSDVCAAYVPALRASCRLEPGSVFNLGSGTSRHVGGILADLIRLAGVAPQIVIERGKLLTVDLVRTEVDARSAYNCFIGSKRQRGKQPSSRYSPSGGRSWPERRGGTPHRDVLKIRFLKHPVASCRASSFRFPGHLATPFE